MPCHTFPFLVLSTVYPISYHYLHQHCLYFVRLSIFFFLCWSTLFSSHSCRCRSTLQSNNPSTVSYCCTLSNFCRRLSYFAMGAPLTHTSTMIFLALLFHHVQLFDNSCPYRFAVRSTTLSAISRHLPYVIFHTSMSPFKWLTVFFYTPLSRMTHARAVHTNEDCLTFCSIIISFHLPCMFSLYHTTYSIENMSCLSSKQITRSFGIWPKLRHRSFPHTTHFPTISLPSTPHAFPHV